jgi:porin
LLEEFNADWQPADWKGRIALGAWQRTGKTSSFAGLNQSGARGVYFVGEQKFWRHQRHPQKQEQSLSAFVQLGSAPSAFSAFTRHIGAGLVWNAPLARRDHDSAGFAITRGRFTTEPAADFDDKHETVIETNYRFQLLNQLSLSPDFQYVIHPGGLSSNRNIYALGARIIFSLRSHAE